MAIKPGFEEIYRFRDNDILWHSLNFNNDFEAPEISRRQYPIKVTDLTQKLDLLIESVKDVIEGQQTYLTRQLNDELHERHDNLDSEVLQVLTERIIGPDAAIILKENEADLYGFETQIKLYENLERTYEAFESLQRDLTKCNSERLFKRREIEMRASLDMLASKMNNIADLIADVPSLVAESPELYNLTWTKNNLNNLNQAASTVRNIATMLDDLVDRSYEAQPKKNSEEWAKRIRNRLEGKFPDREKQ